MLVQYNNPMTSLIALIGQFAPYIYAVCGLTALFQMYRAWQVRQERRQALFSYEREKAVRELYSIFFTALILLMVMAGAYFTSTTLKNAVGTSQDPIGTASADFVFVTTPTSVPLPSTPTNTPEATATDTVLTLPGIDTPVPADPAQTVTATVVISPALPPPTLPPAPATAVPATPVPAAPVAASACSDPRSQISSPSNGQVVSGFVSIVGTASHEQFQYYKLEYAPGANVDDGYSHLGGGQDQVLNGVLLSFDARTLAPGPWTLRLTVVDHTGNWVEPRCKVTITVN